MKSENPRIDWAAVSARQCLRFTFGERLTTREAELAIAEWREAFLSKKDEAIILIWDCRKMKGYDSAARSIWTDALKEMKPQIDTIWLITDSTVVRMGAYVMGMLTSLNIKVVASETEIGI